MMSIMHLSGNHDAGIGQQILDVTEVQVESKVKPCSLVDELARTAVVTATDLRHSLGCPAIRKAQAANAGAIRDIMILNRGFLLRKAR